MTDACKVSVIIPVYNMAKYLDQTIASWMAQTLKNIEIIFVDDGSTDDSLRKLEDKARSDKRFHICSFSTNKGPWAARNYGLEKATGQYILFADADDTVLPETCEELASAIDKSQVDILQYSVKVLNTNKLSEQEIASVERWSNPYEELYYGKEVFTICFLQKKYCWNLWGKIFKTEICKRVLGDIVAMGIKDQLIRTAEDGLLYFMLAYTAQSYKGVTTKKYYQYYYGRGGLGHRYYTLQYFKELCRESHVSELMGEFLKKQGTLETYEHIFVGTRQRFLTNTVLSWSNRLAEEDKAKGFELMLSFWRSDEVIGKLAEIRFNDTATLAKVLQSAPTLRYNGRRVKTIAAYYYRIANGGTERVLCQLCHIWYAMGYKVIVLTDTAPCDDDFELPSGTERIVIPDFNSITPQNYYKRAEAFQRLVTDYHIDAVVYHAWTNRFLFWDQLAIKTAGAACTVFCHSLFTVGMLGNTRYKNILAPLAMADSLITLNTANYSFWKHYNANVHVTINPLSDDISKWKPAPFTASHKILWVGRLSPEKNPMDVLPVMQEVVKDVPDAVLTIVGKSENGSIEKQLQEHISRLHLEEHIRLEGFHTDVRPWYLASQVFLMTSRSEGYSMTLQEGKMAGIPCVMYELPYLTLCEGNRGIIPVPQKDTQAAAQAIIRLLQNDALCEQYGRDARAHIEELAQFDFKKKWQQIFESVEQTHVPIVSKAEQLMMETLIDYHDREISRLKRDLDSRNREIYQLRHGSYIRRVARAVVPNRAKPYLKAMLHRIPQGIKNPIKRLLHC